MSFKDVLGFEISHCFYCFIRRLSSDSVGRQRRRAGKCQRVSFPPYRVFSCADGVYTCAPKIISQTGLGGLPPLFSMMGCLSLRLGFLESKGLREGSQGG